MPPQSEPITGMPLIIASMAVSGWFSHHNEGIRAIRVRHQNPRGSGVLGRGDVSGQTGDVWAG